jgi:hypothetical protein
MPLCQCDERSDEAIAIVQAHGRTYVHPNEVASVPEEPRNDMR